MINKLLARWHAYQASRYERKAIQTRNEMLEMMGPYMIRVKELDRMAVLARRKALQASLPSRKVKIADNECQGLQEAIG